MIKKQLDKVKFFSMLVIVWTVEPIIRVHTLYNLMYLNFCESFGGLGLKVESLPIMMIFI